MNKCHRVQKKMIILKDPPKVIIVFICEVVVHEMGNKEGMKVLSLYFFAFFIFESSKCTSY